MTFLSKSTFPTCDYSKVTFLTTVEQKFKKSLKYYHQRRFRAENRHFLYKYTRVQCACGELEILIAFKKLLPKIVL